MSSAKVKKQKNKKQQNDEIYGISKPMIAIMIIIYWAPTSHQMQSWVSYISLIPTTSLQERHNYLHLTNEKCVITFSFIQAIPIEFQVALVKGTSGPYIHCSETSPLFQISALYLLPLFIHSTNAYWTCTMPGRHQALGLWLWTKQSEFLPWGSLPSRLKSRFLQKRSKKLTE